MSDAESLSFRQELELLADSSQVTEATDLVQSGEFPLLYPQGNILPSSLVATGYSVDDSTVTIGTEPKSDEKLPEPESEDVAPSINRASSNLYHPSHTNKALFTGFARRSYC